MDQTNVEFELTPKHVILEKGAKGPINVINAGKNARVSVTLLSN